MDWILVAIIAHLFYAIVFVLDKYLLKQGFPNPLSYAFWGSILSIFVIFLAPFGFTIPSGNQIIFSLITGLIWFLAVIVFYTALHKGESSRVVPTVGSFIPIFTLALSFLFLGERLSLKQLFAFCLLVIGGAMLSFLISKTRVFSNHSKIKLIKAFIPALGAAFIFSIYFVMTKFVFTEQAFISGLIWIRVGAVISALLLLLFPSFRKIIFKKKSIVNKTKVFGLFLSAKIFGAIAGLLFYWAIFLGSVSLVNSLKGIQYLFLLLFAFILFRKIPSLKEHFSKTALTQKIIAIFLITIGLALLVL